jgi:hypothetical protein
MKGGVSDNDKDFCFLTENSLKYVFHIDGSVGDSLKKLAPPYRGCETDAIKKVAAMAWNELSATLNVSSASMINPPMQNRKLCLLAQDILNAVCSAVSPVSDVAEALETTPAAPRAEPIVVPEPLLKRVAMEPLKFVLPSEPSKASPPPSAEAAEPLVLAVAARPQAPNGEVEPLQKKLKLLEQRVEETMNILSTIRQELLAACCE